MHSLLPGSPLHLFTKKADDKTTRSGLTASGVLAILTLFAVLAAGSALATEAAALTPHGPFGWVLNYLAKKPFAYLFLALAHGYPLGQITVGGINLGATAGRAGSQDDGATKSSSGTCCCDCDSC